MQLKLIDKKPIIDDQVISFIFEPAEPITWKAGQYMEYTLHHSREDERDGKRFFTISAAPHEKNIAITSIFAQDAGSSFKAALKNMEIGDTIEAEGPNGRFVIDDPQEEYVFIAGGIGVTPFRSIILDLDQRDQPLNITLLWGNRTDKFPLNDEIKAVVEKHKSLRVEYFVDPKRIGEEDIRKAAPDLKKPYFYISGPEPMVQAFEKLLADMGVPLDHIKRDYFPGYTWP